MKKSEFGEENLTGPSRPFFTLLHSFVVSIDQRINQSVDRLPLNRFKNQTIDTREKLKIFIIANKKEMVRKLLNSLLRYLIETIFLNKFTLIVHDIFAPVKTK